MSSNFIMMAAVSDVFVIQPGIKPDQNQVIFLMHFDGINGAVVNQTNVDEKKHDVSNTGSVKYSSFGAKFGATGVVTGGVAQWLSFNSHTTEVIGTQDFTLELWIKPSLLGRGLLRAHNNAVSGINAYIDANGRLHFSYGDDKFLITGPNVISINQWHHVAITRFGNVVTIWVNGKSRAVAVREPSQFNIVDSYWLLGNGLPLSGGEVIYSGYVDEFRLVRGLAVYQEEFTSPTQPFTL